MPALIQNTPTFTPFSFEQYIAPLQAYKQEYDVMEKKYDEIEAAASALEALAADDPHSQAYRTYRNYADKLRAEADALAYNGLTPGSRNRLRSIRNQYTTDIIPIVRGMEKWEKEKERARNLKTGEIMSIDPTKVGVDYYIGANPSARILNLENVRKNAELTGKAWSERLYGDLSPFALDGVYDGAAFMMSQLQGFVAGGPEGQNSTAELRNAAQSLSTGKSNPYSEGITLLANQLEALGYDQFDAQGKKEILNSVLMGYGQGLSGSYEYRGLPTSSSSSGKVTPIVTNMPRVHSRVVPIIGHSEQAQQDMKTLGVTKDKTTGNWSYDSEDKEVNFTRVSPGMAGVGSYIVTLNEMLPHYKEVMDGKQVTINKNNKQITLNDHKNQLNNIVTAIERYNPTVAQQIKEGTFNGDIDNVIKDIVNNIQSNTVDYGARVYDMTLNDENDKITLQYALKNYLKSNKGEYEIMNLSSDGKTFAETKSNKSELDLTEDYNKLSVVGVSFLPTDSNHIIMNITYDGEPVSVKLPITAVGLEAQQALANANEHTTNFTNFATKHGKLQQPDPDPNIIPTDMENVWTALMTAEEEYKKLPTNQKNNFKLQELIVKKLETLAQQQDKDKNYYIDLYTDYLDLEYKSQMMYPKFIQELGYAIGTTDYTPTKQSTSYDVITGTK